MAGLRGVLSPYSPLAITATPPPPPLPPAVTPRRRSRVNAWSAVAGTTRTTRRAPLSAVPATRAPSPTASPLPASTAPRGSSAPPAPPPASTAVRTGYKSINHHALPDCPQAIFSSHPRACLACGCLTCSVSSAEPGKFASAEGESSCSACGAGSASAVSGATACADCPPGR